MNLEIAKSLDITAWTARRGSVSVRESEKIINDVGKFMSGYKKNINRAGCVQKAVLQS